MDILFAGNTAAVSEGFYNAIEKEYRCIVLNESCTKDKLKKKNILFFKSENDEEHSYRLTGQFHHSCTLSAASPKTV